MNDYPDVRGVSDSPCPKCGSHRNRPSGQAKDKIAIKCRDCGYTGLPAFNQLAAERNWDNDPHRDTR